MRALMTILAWGLLFAGALVGLTYVYENPGYVMIAVGKGYVEMTLLTLLVWLVGIWLVMRTVVFVFSRIWRLKSQTSFYFFNKSEKKAQLALRQGLTAYLLGDYKRAEQLLSGSGKHSGLLEHKHMFAAAAADANGDDGKVLMHLNALDEDDSDTVLLKAKLMLNRHEWSMAHELVEPLYKSKPKEDAVLRVYIETLEGKEDWQTLLSMLPLVEKRKLFDEQALSDFTAKVVRGALFDTAQKQNFDAAEQQFNTLPGKLKKQDSAIGAYVQLLLENGRGEQAQTVLVKAMKKSSVEAFMPLFRAVRFDQVIELNKFLQSALKKDENDPHLLRALGYVAAGRGDWGLVVNSMSRTLGPGSDINDLKTLAKAYSELGDSQNALAIYQKLQSH